MSGAGIGYCTYRACMGVNPNLQDGAFYMNSAVSDRYIKDGTGIIWAQRVGLTVGFLSARTSAATA